MEDYLDSVALCELFDECIPLFSPLLTPQRKRAIEDYLDSVAFQLKRRRTIKKRYEIKVYGALMGAWGKEKYGIKPVKVDAIQFWTDRWGCWCHGDVGIMGAGAAQR